MAFGEMDTTKADFILFLALDAKNGGLSLYNDIINCITANSTYYYFLK